MQYWGSYNHGVNGIYGQSYTLVWFHYATHNTQITYYQLIMSCHIRKWDWSFHAQPWDNPWCWYSHRASNMCGKYDRRSHTNTLGSLQTYLGSNVYAYSYLHVLSNYNCIKSDDFISYLMQREVIGTNTVKWSTGIVKTNAANGGSPYMRSTISESFCPLMSVFASKVATLRDPSCALNLFCTKWITAPIHSEIYTFVVVEVNIFL